MSSYSLKRWIGATAVSVVGLVYANPVLAQITSEIGATGATLALSTSDPKTIAVRIINVALSFLALIAVVLILYAGFTWMTAAGNEDKVATAKQILIAAIIGLLIIFAAWGITRYVISAFATATGTTVGTTPTP